MPTPLTAAQLDALIATLRHPESTPVLIIVGSEKVPALAAHLDPGGFLIITDTP